MEWRMPHSKALLSLHEFFFCFLVFSLLSKPSVGDKFHPSLLASDRRHYNYHILQAQQKCELQLNAGRSPRKSSP